MISESETDSSLDRSNHIDYIKPTRRDLLPVILSGIIILSGLFSTLMGYFLVQNQEIPYMKSILTSVSNSSSIQTNYAFSNIMSNIMYPNSLYNMSQNPLDVRQDAFTNLMYSNNNKFPPFIWSVSYCQYVNYGTIDQFQDLMRSKGGNMANFTITGRDALNQVIPIDRNYDHLVILWTVPLLSDDKIRGYAITTDYAKNQTAIKARNTRLPSVSQATILGNRDDLAIAMAVSTPIFNQSNGVVVGSLNGAIVIGDLLDDALKDITKDLTIVLLDLTPGAPNQGFIYANIKDPKTGRVVNYTQVFDTMKRSPITVSGNVTLVDRNLSLVLIPTQTWLYSHQKGEKWIALILSLLLTGIALAMVLCGTCMSRLINARKDMLRRRTKFEELTRAQANLQDLYTQLALHNKKFATLFNSSPYPKLVVSRNAIITDINPKFEQLSGYGRDDIVKELTLASVISADILGTHRTNIQVEINMKNGNTCKLEIQVIPLYELISGSENAQEDAYMIIGNPQ